MKIAIFNDTGIFPHIGCMAVSDAHIRMLAGHKITIAFRSFNSEETTYWTGDRPSSLIKLLDSPLRSRLEAVDAVIVNGEGTIHHGFGVHLLAILEAAQHLGKKSLLVNAVLQDVNQFDDVLAQLTDLTVRDLRSSEFMSQRGIPHRIVADSFLEAEFEPTPLFDLSGRIVVSDWHPAREADVGSAMHTLIFNSDLRPFYLPLVHGIYRQVWRRIPSTLSSADLLVTGRHHGIYLSALAGIPFVALPGNTHKIEGLISLSGYEIPVCTRYNQLEAAIQFARNNNNVYKEFNHWLLSQKPLSTFQSIVHEKSDDTLHKALIDKEIQRFNTEVRSRGQHDRLPENWNLWPPFGASFTRY